MKFFFIIISFATVILFSSCLRFIPSLAETEDSTGKEASDSSRYLGEKAFYSLEETQKKRLAALLAERQTEKSTENERFSYRIGAGDLLELVVFDVKELNRSIRVRPSGYISLPLVGEIYVSNRTEAEVQSSISTKLEEFLHNPQVQIFIADYAAHKVSVIGAVHKPGSYPLRRNSYSLIELLSEAGGRNDSASSIIVLIPSANAGPQRVQQARARFAPTKNPLAMEIAFDDLVGSINNPPLRLPLRAGDTIVVPEAGRVQVLGEVNRPGSHQLTSRMSLLGSVAAAEGLTYSADVSEVEVIRELAGGRKALLRVDLEDIGLQNGNDIRLRDGDVVRVPSHSTRFATRQVVDSLNKLFSFGLSTRVGP